MSGTAEFSDDGRKIIVRVPLRVHRRGGRKLMIVSDAPQAMLAKSKVDDAILKALGRAYRWSGCWKRASLPPSAIWPRPKESITHTFDVS